jgi:hypothetical protein
MKAEIVSSAEHKRLEELAANPKNRVLKVTHDFEKEPWESQRVAKAVQTILDKSMASDISDDFKMRKNLLNDPEIKAFQFDHPRMFFTLTDRNMMREPKYRKAIEGMLNVHRMMEKGVVQKGDVASAVATQTVMHALNGGVEAKEEEAKKEEEEEARVEEL